MVDFDVRAEARTYLLAIAGARAMAMDRANVGALCVAGVRVCGRDGGGSVVVRWGAVAARVERYVFTWAFFICVDAADPLYRDWRDWDEWDR